MNVSNKLICLSLNSSWQPIGWKTVKDAIIDLCGAEASGKPTSLALDISYKVNDDGSPDVNEIEYMNPVAWKDWVDLPIRSWDLVINSPRRVIRVPTVVIATNYSRMPVKHFRGKPSKDAIFNRDNGVCQYSGKKLDKSTSTLDHVIPRSKGGADTWDNLVLCDKDVNLKKGNLSNAEAGLRLLKTPTAPNPVPVSALIKEARHHDWLPFLITGK